MSDPKADGIREMAELLRGIVEQISCDMSAANQLDSMLFRWPAARRELVRVEVVRAILANHALFSLLYLNPEQIQVDQFHGRIDTMVDLLSGPTRATDHALKTQEVSP